MPKIITFRQGLLSVLFWSIISAAFIGPGTVTTAARSGAEFGLDLMWALIFSIFATIVLQEAAARITIASGKSLGEIIALKYSQGSARRLRWAVFLAVAFGCAAYEAGNILGALSGLALFSNIPQWLPTIALGLVCGAFLWIGSFRAVAHLLGMVVALMGIAFILVAFRAEQPAVDVLAASVRPSFPAGSALLVIGLIGTTIVPYNLFLASGISQGQQVAEMRWGVVIAVVIGGIISAAIMVVGTLISGDFSFEALAAAMAGKMAPWAAALFGFGLFAAGLSSAITSPLAAAVTARSLFGAQSASWSTTSRNFRLVWGVVLGIGLLFGLMEVRPIPAIILAQAINGILLPIVAVFLILAVNDRALLPRAFLNSAFSNILMLFIVAVTCFLGLNNLWNALGSIVPLEGLPENFSFYLNGGLALGIVGWLAVAVGSGSSSRQ